MHRSAVLGRTHCSHTLRSHLLLPAAHVGVLAVNQGNVVPPCCLHHSGFSKPTAAQSGSLQLARPSLNGITLLHWQNNTVNPRRPCWLLFSQHATCNACVVTLQHITHHASRQHDQQPAIGMQQPCAYAAAAAVLLDVPTSADMQCIAPWHPAARCTSPQRGQHEAALLAGEQCCTTVRLQRGPHYHKRVVDVTPLLCSACRNAALLCLLVPRQLPGGQTCSPVKDPPSGACAAARSARCSISQCARLSQAAG